MVTGTGRLRLSGSPTAVFARSQRGAPPADILFCLLPLTREREDGRGGGRGGRQSSTGNAPARYTSRLQMSYVLYAQRLIHNPIQERALGQVSRTPSEEANAWPSPRGATTRPRTRPGTRPGPPLKRFSCRSKEANAWTSADEDTDATETFILCFFRIF